MYVGGVVWTAINHNLCEITPLLSSPILTMGGGRMVGGDLIFRVSLDFGPADNTIALNIPPWATLQLQ